MNTSDCTPWVPDPFEAQIAPLVRHPPFGTNAEQPCKSVLRHRLAGCCRGCRNAPQEGPGRTGVWPEASQPI